MFSKFGSPASYLIGTFCIVNCCKHLAGLAEMEFNRNILYCKSIYFFYNSINFTDLIGTFCIVNELENEANEFAAEI